MTIKDFKMYIKESSSPNKDTGCWEWNRSRFKQGYGIATLPNKKGSGLAHRLSFVIFVEELSDLDIVMHSCDNPCCVNPSHLRKGTQKDNMEDMKYKNRSPNRKGENGTTVKLNISAVSYIKEYPKVRGSVTLLAKMFNVSKSTISDIRKGKTWK